ncbi:MAG: alanine racemase [Blastomonas sp.]
MNNLRLTVDRDALVRNWQALDRLSGSARAGAAIKADGYGLGASRSLQALQAAGCQDFFVAHWEEAAGLAGDAGQSSLSVLHGIGPADMELANSLAAVPVLNTADQVARWKALGGGTCHVMFDTGMNRLGLAMADIGNGLLDGLDIDICMSHLASADEDSAQNTLQLARFLDIRQGVKARRYSLANSAGIMLGSDYHFDLTRPGLALYGGVPRADMQPHIETVASLEARLMQLRTVPAGDSIGYGATFVARRDMRVGVVSLGYADGFQRSLSGQGVSLRHGDADLPLLGRISMDLVCIDLGNAPHLAEGDWVTLPLDLLALEAASGIAQYEQLTHLGQRFERVWR